MNKTSSDVIAGFDRIERAYREAENAPEDSDLNILLKEYLRLKEKNMGQEKLIRQLEQYIQRREHVGAEYKARLASVTEYLANIPEQTHFRDRYFIETGQISLHKDIAVQRLARAIADMLRDEVRVEDDPVTGRLCFKAEVLIFIREKEK